MRGELQTALETNPYERREVRGGYRNALQPLSKTAPLSKSAVSRVVATLKDGLEAWRTRLLADLDLIYAYLDGFGRPYRRASLLAVLALGFLAAPLAVEAQPSGKMWRIAYLSLFANGANPIDGAFEAATRSMGYVEGQNLVIERRFLGKHPIRLDDAVTEVVRLNADVLVTWGIPWSAAAKRATSTIPVVFVSVRAPVERGLVASLAKPGANVTGLSTFPVAIIDPKMFELARELVPQLSRVGVLRSTDDPPGTREAQDAAARTLGLSLSAIPFSTDKDTSHLRAALERSKPQVLVVPGTVLQFAHREAIIALAAKKRVLSCMEPASMSTAAG